MSWPWRPNTWEKGLRLQVSISSMAEFLREVKCPSPSERKKYTEGQPPSVAKVGCRTGAISSSHSLNWLLICWWSHLTTSPTPFPGLSFAFYSCLPADCRSVLCIVTSDAVRVAAASQLMGDLCWVALSLLIRAPMWRCFRQRAQQTQHEQSKRERGRVSDETEKPAAERRHTLSPDGSENTDDSVCMCVSVCIASSNNIL